MKRFMISGIAILLVIGNIYAVDKETLRLPLNLTPGITSDSAQTILSSLGAIYIPDREGNFGIEFSFAGIPMKTIIPVYLKSGLISVSMYSESTNDKQYHISRLKKAYGYINKTYDCKIVAERFTSREFPPDLEDGIELASFSTKDLSLLLNSEYKQVGGYRLNINLYVYPLKTPQSAK